MIIIQQNNLNPVDRNGFAICQASTPLIIPDEVQVDGIDCSNCQYFEYAFKGDNDKTNDTTSVLLTYPKAPTTKSYILLKGCTEIIIDSTIAEIFDRGTLSVEDKEGIVIDWGKVYDLYGGGNYTINIKYNLLGINYETKSHIYKVLPYTPILAINTYRIDFIKDCYFEDGRNYEGLQWSEKHRLNGYFGNKTPNIEIDSYINGNRIDEIIQRDLYFNYESKVLIPLHVQKNILEGTSFDCLVTTYEQKTENYTELPVIFEEITSEEYKSQKNRLFSIVVRDKLRNNIKRY